MNQVNPNLKHHFVIGSLLALWCFLFAFFVKPFEHGQMDLSKWLYVSIGFSLMVLFSYAVVSFLQRFLFLHFKRWNLTLELVVYSCFYLVYTTTTFLYYKSDFVAGYYTFSDFFTNITLNIVLILTPLLLFVRRYALKLIPKAANIITIKGENKLDILKIAKNDLICVSNAQNYVEVFYLEADTVQVKLMRSTLKKVQAEFDFLIQIHRSHLLNPTHFKHWIDGQTIKVTQKELPVSKRYKDALIQE